MRDSKQASGPLKNHPDQNTMKVGIVVKKNLPLEKYIEQNSYI